MQKGSLRPLAVLVLALFAQQPAFAGPEVFQVSTLAALMAGVYDGEVTVGELRRRGDLGLGTFNRLDGEMAVIDGRVFQVKITGEVLEADDSLRIPFAQVTAFRPQTTLTLDRGLDLPGLERALDARVANPSRIQAARIEGRFAAIRTRSVAAQAQPYRPLTEIIPKEQAVFDETMAEGSLIGFRFPAQAAGVNVPGWHFHFLTADRKRGGHVLALALDGGTAALEEISELRIALPGGIGTRTSATPYDPKKQATGTDR
ncbi:MAG: acetolactate decarboxylase [Magnetospirillum sp. WYHS-4]